MTKQEWLDRNGPYCLMATEISWDALTAEGWEQKVERQAQVLRDRFAKRRAEALEVLS